MKKKWAVWKTILVIFSSVFLISGVTVAAVFLSKGGSGDVYPEDLFFVTEEQPLYNSATGRFEITEKNVRVEGQTSDLTEPEFTLTISSTTPDVTEKRVELSLKNGITDRTANTITDRIITIPRYVNLDEPFKIIRLNTSIQAIDSLGHTENCITGGISTLTAKSIKSSELGTGFVGSSIEIAVDTPVRNIEIELYGQESVEAITDITENEEFYARAVFYPRATTQSKVQFNSQFLFNNPNNYKKVYYAVADGTTQLTFKYDADKIAKQEATFVSGEAGSAENKIVAYAFQSADTQLSVLESMVGDQASVDQTDEDIYIAVRNWLSTNKEKVTNTANIAINVADPTSFVRGNHGNTLSNMTIGHKYKLALQNFGRNDDYLDVSIKSGDEVLSSQLRNVAIAFTKDNGTGDYVSADEELTVTDENGTPLQYKEVGGVKYYLANTNVNDIRAGYWLLSTTSNEPCTYHLQVVLLQLVDRATDEWKLFKDVLNYNLPSVLDDVKQVDWADDVEDIRLVLPQGQHQFTSDEFKNVPAGKAPLFFAYFNSNAVAADDVAQNMLDSFDKTHSGVYTVGSARYYLYALGERESLNVKGTGSFQIYLANAKMTDNSYDLNENGLYQILSFSRARNVVVTEMLNQNSIEGESTVNITLDNQVVDEGKLYIYPGQNAKFEATIKVSEGSWGVFRQVYGDITFGIYSHDRDITDYFIPGDVRIDDNANTAVFSFTLKSETDLIEHPLNSAGLQITNFKLSEPQSECVWEPTAKHANAQISEFYIYQPQLTAIRLKDLEDTGSTATVKFILGAQNGFSTVVEYGAGLKVSVSEYVGILVGLVELTELHGNIEYFKNRWEFATNNTDAVKIDHQSFDFNNRVENSETAELYVKYDGVESDEKITLTFDSTQGTIQSIEPKDGSTVNGTSSVAVTKVGTTGTQQINLRDLFTLKTADGNFDDFQIRFNSSTISRLDRLGYLDDLFGENGMISIGASENKASYTREELLALQDIISLTINKDFVSSGEVLGFVIYNDEAYVNIDLELTISTSYQITVSTPTVGTADKPVYAGDGINIEEYLSSKGTTGFADKILGTGTKKYIVLQNNGYVASDMPDGAVGEVYKENEHLTVKFNDFWDVASKTFWVTFGNYENHYTAQFSITFNVSRNMKVVSLTSESGGANKDYVVGGDDDNSFWTYFSLQRATDGTFGDQQSTMQDNIIIKPTGTKYFSVRGSNLTLAEIIFGYNVQKLVQTFEIYYSEGGREGVNVNELDPELDSNQFLGEVTLDIVPVASYQQIADAITFDETTKAKLVTLDGVSYVYVPTGSAKFDVEGSQLSGITVSNRIVGDSNQTSNYSAQTNGDVYFNTFSNAALKGEDNSDIFLIIKLSNIQNAFMKVPLIISNIGMDLVKYSTDANNTLENALADFASLQERGVYYEVSAGQEIQIVHTAAEVQSAEVQDKYGFIIKDNNITYEISHTYEKCQTGLTNLDGVSLFKSCNDGKLSLNHLDKKTGNVYLGLELRVSNYTISKTYRFLLLVKPDVEVAEGATYAYSEGYDSAEYIASELSQSKTIELDEAFGAEHQTLHDGEFRFNVKKNDERMTDLVFTHQLISLVDETGKPCDFTSVVNGKFASTVLQGEFTYSQNKATLTLTPVSERKQLTLTFARVYSGSGSALSIVTKDGYAKIEYKVIINPKESFTIEYTDNGNHRFSNHVGNNATLDVDKDFKTENGLTFDVDLKSGSTGAEGLNMIEPDLKGVLTSVEFTPGTTNEAGKLTIKRADYVEKDTPVVLTFYTEQGYLGELTLNVKASGSVTFKAASLDAGKSYNVKTDIINQLSSDGDPVSDYTVDSITSNSNLFGGFTGGNLTLKASILNAKIDLTFTITLNETNKYVFTHTFNVTANVTKSNGGGSISDKETLTVIGGEVTAKADKTILQTKLFNTTENTAANVTYSYQLSNGTAEDVELPAAGNTLEAIGTNYVAQRTTIIVRITITLASKQTFYVDYTFYINPDVTIEHHYPNIGNGEMDAEYLSDNTTFNSAADFANGTAFGNISNRFIIDKSKSQTPEDDTATLTIPETVTVNGEQIPGKQNADILRDTSSTAYNFNEPMGKMVFHATGTGDSYVYVRLTYHEVVHDYKVIIVDRAFSLVTSQSGYGNTGDTELLYVDKYTGADSKNILAKNRLFTVTFKDSVSLVGRMGKDYVAKFTPKTATSGTTTKIEFSFRLTEAYAGKTVTFDILQSAESFDGIYDSSDTTNTDLSDILLAGGVKLSSRLQLQYGGQDVAYDKYSGILKFTGLTGSDGISSYTIAPTNIDTPCTLNDFTLNLGNTLGFATTEVTFSNEYKYQLDIDIEAGLAGDYTEIKVGQTIPSILSQQLIRRKSDKQPIQAGDINNGVTAELSLVSGSDNIPSDYKSYPGIGNPYAAGAGETDKTQYAFLTFAKKNQNGTDYQLLGQGATNAGNYVLVKFIYTVTVGEKNYSKVFYFVYHVVSDYQVFYQGENTGLMEEVDGKTVPSNRDNPAKLEPNGDEVYSFVVASETDQNSLVTVINTNDNNAIDDRTNVTTRNFTYTLTLNEGVYNNSSNVTGKLGLPNDDWTADEKKETQYTWKGSKQAGKEMKFEKIPLVIFGEQQYKIHAVDKFGYEFYVYFTLTSSQAIPRAHDSYFTIKEGATFDIGAAYESLEIVPDTKSQNTLNIISTPVIPTGTNLLVLDNIKAWGFKEDYTKGDKNYLQADSDHYTVTSGKTISSTSSAEYLTRPQLFDITVTGISFYRNENDSPKSVTLTETKTLATTEDGAGTDPNSVVFTGGTFRAPEENYTMPSLPDNWYGTYSAITVTMAIDLTYEKGGSTEVITVTTQANVSRQHQITAINEKTVVYDGQKFDVDGVFKLDGNAISSDVTFYDDTLKVSLPANNASVTLTLTNGENTSVPYVVTNTFDYPRTQYVSLSQMLGTTIDLGKELTLTVTNASGNGTVGKINDIDYYSYYIEYHDQHIGRTSATSTGSNTLEINPLKEFNSDSSDPTQDSINIENKARITTQGYATVTKYYLAKIGNNDIYQVAQEFKVTPLYYSFDKVYSDQILYLIGSDVNVAKGKIELTTWAAGMKLYKAKIDTEGKLGKDEETALTTVNNGNVKYLYFVINEDSTSAGNATINSSTGEIRLKSALQPGEYISISIYLKFSGFDGQFGMTDYKDMRLLGSVRLGVKAST